MQNFKKISLKKKKSILDFYIFINLLNSKNYYVIENNIKGLGSNMVSSVKYRKVIKSGIFLSKHIIFNDKRLIKYFLSFLYFLNWKDFNTYIVSTNKKVNFLPAVIKVKFLFFKKMSAFSKYLFTYEKICVFFNSRVKPLSLLR